MEQENIPSYGSSFNYCRICDSGLAGENTTMIVVGTVIRSLGVGPILSAVFALVPDVVEYGNWKFGIRSEGLISSAQSIESKIGIGVGSALTGMDSCSSRIQSGSRTNTKLSLMQ